MTGEGRAFANIPESALTDTVSLAFKIAIVFRQYLEDLRPVSGYCSRAPCESFKPWPYRNLIKPTPSEKEFRRYSRPKNHIASSRRGLSTRVCDLSRQPSRRFGHDRRARDSLGPWQRRRNCHGTTPHVRIRKQILWFGLNIKSLGP